MRCDLEINREGTSLNFQVRLRISDIAPLEPFVYDIYLSREMFQKMPAGARGILPRYITYFSTDAAQYLKSRIVRALAPPPPVDEGGLRREWATIRAGGYMHAEVRDDINGEFL